MNESGGARRTREDTTFLGSSSRLLSGRNLFSPESPKKNAQRSLLLFIPVHFMALKALTIQLPLVL